MITPNQLNPVAPVGGSQHWGHAPSRDLVNWEPLPNAILPKTFVSEVPVQRIPAGDPFWRP